MKAKAAVRAIFPGESQSHRSDWNAEESGMVLQAAGASFVWVY